MRNIIALGLVLGTSAATGTATAAEDSELFTLGAGLLGVAGGTFTGKPADKTWEGTAYDADVYPGFAGSALGGGLMIDARFYDVVGLEIDLIQSTDEGSGTLTWNGFDHDITIGQSALHVPVLFKASLPAGLVSPSIFLGPEFVFVGDATASAVAETRLEFEARNSNYTAFAFGIGFEFALPTPIVDLRIPLTLRGSYNPGVSDKLSDRMELTNQTSAVSGSGFRYESNPQYQALFTLGVAAYF
jgi:hypothetical protein